MLLNGKFMKDANNSETTKLSKLLPFTVVKYAGLDEA
jgi:hypothetical protein